MTSPGATFPNTQYEEFSLLCRAKVQGFGQAKVSSNVLKQVEQTDLINYGLIPEFVGRFPIISSLQVCAYAELCCAHYFQIVQCISLRAANLHRAFILQLMKSFRLLEVQCQSFAAMVLF